MLLISKQKMLQINFIRKHGKQILDVIKEYPKIDIKMDL